MDILSKTLVALNIDFGQAANAFYDQTRIFLSIFAGIGVLLVCFGTFNWVTSMESHDNAQKVRAWLTIAGGILLISAKLTTNYLFSGILNPL